MNNIDEMSLDEKTSLKEDARKEPSDLERDIDRNLNGGDNVKIVPDPLTDMPSRFWKQHRENQIYETIKPLNIHTPVYPDRVRFVCISDTHSKLKTEESKTAKRNYFIPPGDVLLHTGDFTMKGRITEIETFNSYLGKLPHTKKVVIAGNHEISLDEDLYTEAYCLGESLSVVKKHLRSKGVASAKDLLTNVIYLQDSMVTICGINIYGSPWTPRCFDWAFSAERGDELLQKWNCIPENVDILMTHGPPAGHGDITKSGINVGCVELLNTVQKRIKPKYHVFGHIHESYGITTDGVTTFINAASCTKGYKLENPPIIFDVPLPHSQSKDSLLKKVDTVSYSIEQSRVKSKVSLISEVDKEKKVSLLLELKKAKTKVE